TIVNRKRCIRDDKIRIDSNHIAVSLANRTRAVRIVETEKVNVRLQEGQCIQFKRTAEQIFLFRIVAFEDTHALPFVECGLDSIGQTVVKALVILNNNTIEDEKHVFRLERTVFYFVQSDHFAAGQNTRIALLKKNFQFLI